VLTATGTVELDASIMEGDRLRCGAVGAVRGIANAITLARRVMDDGRHVLIVGDGALQFARVRRHARVRSRIARHRASARAMARRERTAGAAGTASAAGTVGAVALDRHGTMAAATSTGGIFGKLPGRVGDSR